MGLARLLQYNTPCTLGASTLFHPHTRARPSKREYLRPEEHLARCRAPSITNAFEAVDAGKVRKVAQWHQHRAHLRKPIP